MKINHALPAILVAVIPWFFPPSAAADSCEALTALSLPDTTVTLAKSVAAGALSLPAGADQVPPVPAALPAVALKDLPAFCRVALTIKPSQDSDIKVEVWMPADNWNGKFMAVGNGSWAGAISYGTMGAPLARGYATASTDTGHVDTGKGASFALGHPEKLTDFGYRAVHEMTTKAKAVIAAYYGGVPKLSYWNGCSTGGRQGLNEAQRYPADYDGIVAGDSATNAVHSWAQTVWTAQAVHSDEASYVPPSKFPMIHSAVLDSCDARDGVKDGIIENPMRCNFNPKVLECKGSDQPTCLTAAQVQAVQKIYAPATNPRTREKISFPLMPGSELGWAGQTSAQPGSVAISYFAYVVFKNQNWDYKTFNFDGDVATSERVDNGTINATDPDLKAFFARGGKILQYHGWSDNQIPPLNSVDYYEAVVKKMGGVSRVKDSYRLFMVPAMSHCRNGEGVNNFDSISALEQWVEKGKAPDKITASRIEDGQVRLTRPLCPYPQVAAYKGTGSADDATNFVCRAEPGTARDPRSARRTAPQ